MAAQLAQALTDISLAERVMRALREIGYPALRSVTVVVSEGVVTLDGLVHSYYLKQLAQEVAMRIVGKRVLSNELKVRCRQT
jgi:osmotically-inducible protein OsmY